MQDRDYQTKAQTATYVEYNRGVRQQLISMATGTGKTVVFSKLPTRLKRILPGQSLVLAHREELIDQAIDKMRKINPLLHVDKEMAEHRANPNADVIVASVATLGRAGTSRVNRFNWDAIDKVICDEAHHSTAQSYLNVFDAAGVLRPDTHKLLVGVTATPGRGDGVPLAKVYKKLVFTYSMRDAIEDGWLVEVNGITVNTKTNLSSVKTVAGDFAQDMLADAIDNPERNQLIAKAWLDVGEGRQTIGFTVNIAHAKHLAEMFQHYGIKAEAIWGDDPDRARKLQRHKDREITVLFNCGVLTEGYDDWQVGCIIMARPTKSSTLFTQMVGRGTRLQDNTGNLKELLRMNPNPIYPIKVKNPFRGPIDLGPALTYDTAPVKKDCIVLDVVDVSGKHSLVTLPTLMGLNANLNLKGKGLVSSVKAIEDAQAAYPNIDFTSLRDINEIKSFIERVNLFEVKFPEEVLEYSEFTWHPAPDGGYVLMMPSIDKQKQEVRIKQDLLDKWQISAIIDNKQYKGERETIGEAFQAADSLVQQHATKNLTIVKREAAWHKDPPTEKQLAMLAKFFKGKQLPPNLTKGQASKLIGNHLAGKQ